MKRPILSTIAQAAGRPRSVGGTGGGLARGPSTCPIRVSLEPLRDAAAIEPLWRDLERRADPPFFLSWGWVGCWLRTLPPDVRPWLLCLRDEAAVVGLALVTPRRARRLALFRMGQWWLHETGDPSLDALTMEDNGFLLDPERADLLGSTALRWLLDNAPDCDRLVLGGIDPALERLAHRAAGDRFTIRPLKETVRPFVDLDAVRARGGDHLATLGRSTRYAVRRAARLYEESGPLQFRVAAEADEALDYLARMKHLHQAYWTARGQPGAFAPPAFERFHRRLIRDNFAAGVIQLCRVSAGGRDVGYLYNFIWRNCVHAYQSGFAYVDGDNRLKPGLVSHCLAIRHALDHGHRTYDFMAGDGQHKRSLSTHSARMVWLALTANRLPWTIEHAIRRMKQRLLDKQNS